MKDKDKRLRYQPFLKAANGYDVLGEGQLALWLNGIDS